MGWEWFCIQTGQDGWNISDVTNYNFLIIWRFNHVLILVVYGLKYKEMLLEGCKKYFYGKIYNCQYIQTISYRIRFINMSFFIQIISLNKFDHKPNIKPFMIKKYSSWWWWLKRQLQCYQYYICWPYMFFFF